MISDLICSECYGDGGWDDDVGDWVVCPVCSGTGIHVRDEAHRAALERWAYANGFVREDNVEDSKVHVEADSQQRSDL